MRDDGPRVESKLVALACSVAERREQMADTIVDLGARADPTRLWHAMERNQLTALAGSRLSELGALPPSLEEKVHVRLQDNRVRALYHAWAASRSLEALEAAGIPALPLKGFSLAEDVHADPGMRSYGDIDVLVPVDELHRAGEVLRPLGYLPVDREGPARPELHTVLVDRSAKLPPVEVHWRVHWFEEAFSEQMLARSRIDGRRRALPEDELAALLLFFARDGFLGLRLAADLAAWWDTCRSSLEPGALDALAEQYPALRPVWSTALRVGQRVVGLPARQLMTLDDQRSREKLARRLTNWASGGTHDQQSADVSLVNLLLAPRSALTATSRRHLFLTRRALDDFYDLTPGDHMRRLGWRVVHPPKMLVRYSLGLLRARDKSSSDPGQLQLTR